MKKSVLVKKTAAVAAALICMASFAVSAYADERTPVRAEDTETSISTSADIGPVRSEESETVVDAPEAVLVEETEKQISATDEKREPVRSEDTEKHVSGAPEIVTGDVNNDGVVNAGDVVSVSAHIKGLKTLEDTDAADVNNDGKVNSGDITKISAHVKGIKSL